MNHKEDIYWQWGNGKSEEESIPKIIWTFWDSPAESPLVRICFSQIKELLRDYTFHIIDKKNVKNFLPDIIDPRDDISFINYTDYVRLHILKKYGGVYIDASVLLTENLDWLHKIQSEIGAEMIGFYSEKFMVGNSIPLIETWFIAAVKDSRFISDWCSEFSKCYTSPEPYRFYENEKKDPSFLQGITLEMSNYLIAYLAASKVLILNHQYRLLLQSSLKNGHYYTWGDGAPHHMDDFQKIFLQNKTPNYYPSVIKFMNSRRVRIDNQFKTGKFKLNAFLFEITNTNKLKLFFWRLVLYIKFIIPRIIKKYFHPKNAE